MLAGEEFLRSKSYLGVDDEETFSGNSYNLDYSVNELNYAKKLEHYDLFKNYKKLINFKRTHKGLQLEENEIEGNLTVEALNNNGVMHIAYKGGEGEGNEPFDIYIANGTAKDFQIDESQITREIYLNTANSQIADSKLTIEPFGVLIF